MARQYSKNGSRPMRYDAHGRRIQGNSHSRFLRILLGFLLPYLIINGIVIFFVFNRPGIEAGEPDTKDYRTATVSLRVSSALPLKSLKASLEGEEVALEKSGSSYVASVASNGTLTVTAVSMNRMQSVSHIQINLLDDTAPVIDQENVVLGSGYLEFDVSDTQSGVDFDSIYGIDGDGDNIKPTNINKETGQITFSMKSSAIQVYVQDLAGNEISANFSVN